ncbi:AI-2E family transporter [Geothrix sp. 21YS21S-4]|uniref:AI-2E family transporter n=1 Tax=Geothrix sp. 21YS21S-4 TaxID=3068889 RepID=UPI0027B92855|nr:AI-2E family transporter [Geothrix sp. 21YS21S-4]
MEAPGRIPLRFALVAAAGLLSLWLLRRALAPFFLAMVLAYLLGPLVELLARRLGRPWSVVAVLTGFVAAIAGALLVLLPWLAGQGDRLVASLPRWRQALEAKLLPWLQDHPAWQLRLENGLESLDPALLFQGLRATGGGVLGCFLNLLALILVPLILYYLLLEGPGFVPTLRSLAPPRYRPRLDRMAKGIHQRLGGYIRGQAAVAAAMAVLQALGFAILGVPYAWLLGLVAGISNVVPYSPYFTALPPALILAYLDGGRGGHLAAVAATFIAVQKAEAFYFTPVWVGRASRLHPLEVLLALTAFGFWFGVLGLIFAVPLAVILKVLLEEILADYRAHPWFGEEG